MNITINYCCHRYVITIIFYELMSKRGHAGVLCNKPNSGQDGSLVQQRLTGNLSRRGKVTQRRSLPLAFCCMHLKDGKERSEEEFGKALTSSSLLP